MIGQTIVGDRGMKIVRVLGTPESAFIMGGSQHGKQLSLSEAEMAIADHLRKHLGLEEMGEMPPVLKTSELSCSHCRMKANLRCSVCRTCYCSRCCQKKAWLRHVFVCRIAGRPNDVDRLRYFTKATLPKKILEETVLKWLFADADFCRNFGFSLCYTPVEVARLTFIYHLLAFSLSARDLQNAIDAKALRIAMIDFVVLSQQRDVDSDPSPEAIAVRVYFHWFRKEFSARMELPDGNKYFTYLETSLNISIQQFAEGKNNDQESPTGSPSLRTAAFCVTGLYATLWRPFNNIPDVYSDLWFQFGFCFCKSTEESNSLSEAYLDLVNRGTSLQDIAVATQDSSLLELMRLGGVDVSILAQYGIEPGMPDTEEIGIYRFMAEVAHALSGYHCMCTKPSCAQRSQHETLCRESEGEYGFHGGNTWERWQLLNFYAYLFESPGFDPRKMQEARRHDDNKALEDYIETLVPDFKKKVGNFLLADAMFPKLRSRTSFSPFRPYCLSIVHSCATSDGLDLCGPALANHIRRAFKTDEEGGASVEEKSLD